MSELLSTEEVDRLATNATAWRRADSSECYNRDATNGYVGTVEGVNVEVYRSLDFFVNRVKIVISANGFTIGYSCGLPMKRVTEHYKRAEVDFEARLSRAREQTLENARRLSA